MKFRILSLLNKTASFSFSKYSHCTRATRPCWTYSSPFRPLPHSTPAGNTAPPPCSCAPPPAPWAPCHPAHAPGRLACAAALQARPGRGSAKQRRRPANAGQGSAAAVPDRAAGQDHGAGGRKTEEAGLGLPLPCGAQLSAGLGFLFLLFLNG